MSFFLIMLLFYCVIFLYHNWFNYYFYEHVDKQRLKHWISDIVFLYYPYPIPFLGGGWGGARTCLWNKLVVILWNVSIFGQLFKLYLRLINNDP